MAAANGYIDERKASMSALLDRAAEETNASLEELHADITAGR